MLITKTKTIQGIVFTWKEESTKFNGTFKQLFAVHPTALLIQESSKK